MSEMLRLHGEVGPGRETLLRVADPLRPFSMSARYIKVIEPTDEQVLEQLCLEAFDIDGKHQFGWGRNYLRLSGGVPLAVFGSVMTRFNFDTIKNPSGVDVFIRSKLKQPVRVELHLLEDWPHAVDMAKAMKTLSSRMVG